MDKRTILAIVLCAGILFAWAKFFAPQPVPATAVSPPTEAMKQNAAPPPAPAPDAPGLPAAAVAAGAPAPTSFPERDTTVETPVELFVFSNQGAALRHAQLREKKYQPKVGEVTSIPAGGIDLIRTADPRQAPLRISFPDSSFPTPPDASWRLVEDAPPPPSGVSQVVYRSETPALRIEKRFLIDATRYRIHLDVTVENRSAAPQDHHLAIQLFGHQDPEAKGGFLSGSTGNTANVLCHADDKTVRESMEKLEKEPLERVGAVSWIGSDEKFFLTAAIPYPESPPRERRCAGTSIAPGTGQVQLSFAERHLPPGGHTDYSFAVYIGPKIVADLDDVRPGGVDVKLGESVDVSLAVISRPMLWLLKFFHGYVRNWGVAIIMLTVFIRLLTFYPTQKSLMSAKRMQKLAPKMAVIRKKYENDKQRQSSETMKLYKDNGVSPFGGCLPSLIQMPIWIALYSTLNYAVELYRSPFVFHIKDLTAKDPYYITPLLMGGVMFIQMKMSPTSPDNQQQATMAVMMPVMFTMFSLVLPSGLAVYMLTSYLIGILQQLFINYLDRRANAPALARG